MSEVKQRMALLICGYCRTESNDMHIVDGIILIILQYHKHATWSNEYKGKRIKLSEDDTKAMCVESSGGHSIRANFVLIEQKSYHGNWNVKSKIRLGISLVLYLQKLQNLMHLQIV